MKKSMFRSTRDFSFMQTEVIKSYFVPTNEDRNFPKMKKKECVIAHHLFPRDVKKRDYDLSNKPFITLIDTNYARNFVKIGDFLIFSYNDSNNGTLIMKNFIAKVIDKKGSLLYYDKGESANPSNGIVTANFIDLGEEKPVIFNAGMTSYHPTVVYSTNFSSLGDFLVMYFHKKPFLLYVEYKDYNYFSCKNILTLRVFTTKWVENTLAFA